MTRIPSPSNQPTRGGFGRLDHKKETQMEQRSRDWLHARRGRITASLTGAILGHSPYMTRSDAMRLMVRNWHNAESEFNGNIATEYGVRHEDGAIVEYTMETGNAVERIGFVERDEWAGCSPDGLIGLIGGVETKCPYGKRKMTAEDDFLPLAEQPHYEDQVQFSLWVCERAWWDFVQWSPTKLTIERVTPDSKWRTKNLPKLKAFYEEYLTEREQPHAAKHLEANRVEIDTPEALRLLSEYDDLAEAIEQATERKKEILTTLTELAKETNAIICGRNLTKVEKEGAVSYTKVVKDHLPDIDLNPYSGKPSSYWLLK